MKHHCFAIVLMTVVMGVAGCDTGNPSVDYGIGKTEVVTGRSAQNVGSALVTAPEPRVKVAGGGLIVGGVALEEDGMARMERASRASVQVEY
jgi:hypothetical protein